MVQKPILVKYSAQSVEAAYGPGEWCGAVKKPAGDLCCFKRSSSLRAWTSTRPWQAPMPCLFSCWKGCMTSKAPHLTVGEKRRIAQAWAVSPRRTPQIDYDGTLKLAGIPAKVVRIYVPYQYFAECFEECQPPGRSSKCALPDALSLSDPTAFSVAKSALAALEASELDVYADACARFLATHLICRFECWSEDLIQKTSATDLSDRRLSRVLELMQHEFASELTTARLAREAGISPFHFNRTFKAKVGVTPHQHLRRLRVQAGTNFAGGNGSPRFSKWPNAADTFTRATSPQPFDEHLEALRAIFVKVYDSARLGLGLYTGLYIFDTI